MLCGFFHRMALSLYTVCRVVKWGNKMLNPMDVPWPLSCPDPGFIYSHGWNTPELINFVNSRVALVPLSKRLQHTKNLQDRWEKGIWQISSDKSDGYRQCRREEILFPWLLPVIFQVVCYRWNQRGDFGDNREDNKMPHEGSSTFLELCLFCVILSR